MIPTATLDAYSRLPRAPGAGWMPAGMRPTPSPVYGTDLAPTAQPSSADPSRLAAPAGPVPVSAGVSVAPPDAMRFGVSVTSTGPAPVLAPPATGTFSRGGAALGPGAGVGATLGPQFGDGSVLAGTGTESRSRAASPQAGAFQPAMRTDPLAGRILAPVQQGVGSADGRMPLSAPLPVDSVADVAGQARPSPLGGARNPMATEIDPTEDPSAPSPELPPDRPRPPRPGKPPKTAPDAAQRGKGGGGIAAYAWASHEAETALESRTLARTEAAEARAARQHAEGLKLAAGKGRHLTPDLLIKEHGPESPITLALDARAKLRDPKLSDSERAAWEEKQRQSDAGLDPEQLALVNSADAAGQLEAAEKLAAAEEAEARLADLTQSSVEDTEAALQKREQAMEGLARQLGLTVEELRLRLENDPGGSLAKRIAEEKKRQEDRERYEAERAAKRATRLRYGDERARAEAALSAARASRDRATAAAGELSRVRGKPGFPKSVSKAYSEAVQLSMALAKAAKSAAKTAKRLAQYGGHEALKSATAYAEDLNRQGKEFDDRVLGLFSRAAHVATHPDPNPRVQSIVQAHASAAAEVAMAEIKAEMEGGYPPGDPPAWLADAWARDLEAKLDFWEGIESGLIDPSEHTSYPDCPPGYVTPPGCWKCPPGQKPWYAHWEKGEGPGCLPENVSAEPAGGKGKGPQAPPASEHATSDEVAPVEPPPPPRPALTVSEPHVPDEPDPPDPGRKPVTAPQVAGPAGPGPVKPVKAPEAGENGEGRPRAETPVATPQAGASQQDANKAEEARTPSIEEQVEREFQAFKKAMIERAAAEGPAWERHVRNALRGNEGKIRKLIEARLANQAAINAAKDKLAANEKRKVELRIMGLTEWQLHELHESIAMNHVAALNARFAMIEQAGAHFLRGSLPDAIGLVRAAHEADQRFGGHRFIRMVEGTASKVAVVLKDFERRDAGARAALELYDEGRTPWYVKFGRGVGSVVKAMTGGENVPGWKRALILGGLIAMGAVTMGTGLAAQAGLRAVMIAAAEAGAGNLYTQIILKGPAKIDYVEALAATAVGIGGGLVGNFFRPAFGIPGRAAGAAAAQRRAARPEAIDHTTHGTGPVAKTPETPPPPPRPPRRPPPTRAPETPPASKPTVEPPEATAPKPGGGRTASGSRAPDAGPAPKSPDDAPPGKRSGGSGVRDLSPRQRGILAESNAEPFASGSDVHSSVPEFRPGEQPTPRTRGVLDAEGVEVPLVSGNGTSAPGPGTWLGENLPGGTGSGNNAQIRGHVEGHAAAIMNKHGIQSADLYLNNAPCRVGAACRTNLHKLLPPGSTLRLHFPYEGRIVTWTVRGGVEPTPFWR